MTLTKRGRMLCDYTVLVLIISGFITVLIYCYSLGQDRQCRWYQRHGTTTQIVAYCRTR